MTPNELTDEQRKAIETVEKLLRLASKNPSQVEAESAAEKAQKILEAHNLTTAEVERAQGVVSGKREQMKQAGGMYEYQRRLWYQVAELNFCVYMTRRVRYFDDRPRIMRERVRHEHHLVGRMVNTAAARTLGSYLEQTVERLCRERLHERGEGKQQFFSRWAVSYREGVTDEIVWRLYERRQQRMSEEQERRRAEAAKMTTGISTATALTLRDVEEREKEANMDFIYGEGFSARKAARRAEAARIAAEEEAKYAEWAKAHPEEARKEEAKREKREARTSRSSFRKKPRDWGGYAAGQEAGKKVSIDPQVDGDSGERRRITHG